MNIEKFVKERNEAMFSLEKEKIVAYCKKYGIHIPENEQVFWAGVYKYILSIENSPEHLRQKAIEWLDGHGFKRTISERSKLILRSKKMNILASVEFSMAALNFGVMIWSICNGGSLWWLNLAVGVFCLCLGLSCIKK